jgi:hypothetical protein
MAATSPTAHSIRHVRPDGQAQLDSAVSLQGAVAIRPDSGRRRTSHHAQPDGRPVAVKASGGIWGDQRRADPTFDTDGTLGSNDTGSDQITSMALQTDSKILIAGDIQRGGLDCGHLATEARRRGALNGSRDATFDTDGSQLRQRRTERARALVARTARSSFRAARRSATTTARVARRASGRVISHALDPTFDTDGVASITAGSTTAAADGVALQPDGKILVAGFHPLAPSRRRVRLGAQRRRRSRNGAPIRRLDRGRGVHRYDGGRQRSRPTPRPADRRLGATFGEKPAMRVLGDPFTLTVAGRRWLGDGRRAGHRDQLRPGLLGARRRRPGRWPQ